MTLWLLYTITFSPLLIQADPQVTVAVYRDQQACQQMAKAQTQGLVRAFCVEGAAL